MTNTDRRAQPQRLHKPRPARKWMRATADSGAVILGGAIAARLVMMTVDTIAARNGSAPGGEIFLAFYAAILPGIGWYLRGAWERAKRQHAKERRQNRCTTDPARDAARTSTPARGATALTNPLQQLYQERE